MAADIELGWQIPATGGRRARAIVIGERPLWQEQAATVVHERPADFSTRSHHHPPCRCLCHLFTRLSRHCAHEPVQTCYAGVYTDAAAVQRVET